MRQFGVRRRARKDFIIIEHYYRNAFVFFSMMLHPIHNNYLTVVTYRGHIIIISHNTDLVKVSNIGSIVCPLTLGY